MPSLRFHFLLLAAAAVAVSPTTVVAGPARTLTFEERVAAREAIERVYHSHQIGATRPFEDSVPRDVIARRVRTYLKQSAALKAIWGIDVTAAMLQAELERITRRSKYPDRLLQISAALGHDPFLIRECFVRPILVNRMARDFFAFDERIHAMSRLEAELLHRRLRNSESDARAPIRGRTVVRLRAVDASVLAPSEDPARAQGRSSVDVPAADFARLRDEVPRRVGDVGELREGRDAFEWAILLDDSGDSFEVARYSVPKQTWDSWWASVQESLPEAAALGAQRQQQVPLPARASRTREPSAGQEFAGPASMPARVQAWCVPDDTWANGSLDAAPAVLRGSTAVWSGTEMIVWGGALSSGLSNRGWRYDPLIDSWEPLGAGAPPARIYHSAVWTGSRMIVWGGESESVWLNDGAQYDPTTDAWTVLPTTNAPTARSHHTAVWTGSQMIVWGGGLSNFARFEVATNRWIPSSTAGAPSQRLDHSAVWTGSEMIIWGGDNGQFTLNSGGRYDPITDSWSSTSIEGAPSSRRDHTAVWTGNQMIVWGGLGSAPASGARYDPSTDTWLPTSMEGAPQGRWLHTAVWSGTHMLVWGGLIGSPEVTTNTGGRYDPSSDNWSATQSSNAPSARYRHTAVWTGDLMLVWGSNDVLARPPGGRYDAAADAWTPLTDGGVLAPRRSHSAVWTGNEMLIWGGRIDNGLVTNTGGRYDPLIDSWSPTATLGAPESRDQHVAAWAGDVMMVWGGRNVEASVNTGGRYDPIADSWSPTSIERAPPPAYDAVAAWTGDRVLVWGGAADFGYSGTGGRYDPQTDRWQPITMQNAPIPRLDHTGVWTGGEFVVWGGLSSTGVLGDGGRYDPESDTWQSIASVDAPSPRKWHVAAWTGGRMVVWGGLDNFGTPLYGGRYDPVTDRWTPVAIADAPLPRYGALAISIGTRVIVWGGLSGGSALNTGGVYENATDTWSSMSTLNAPSPRSGGTMIWTGGVAIPWGGTERVSMGDGQIHHLLANTGGAYGIGNFEDADHDGQTMCAGDCDDSTASIYLGAPEICDGRDDDCDGTIPAGEVDGDGDGAPLCALDCDDADPARFPGNPEVCDSLDNDCDGNEDGFVTGCGIGSCAATGMCVAGSDSCTPGLPAAEVCDGADNDCDGTADNGNPGSGAACSTGLPGPCAAGSTSCEGGQLVCIQNVQPSPEACDNLDNDCDGTVDGFPTGCGTGACSAQGACVAGLDSCTPGQPSPEVCDGIDDDCDGVVPPEERDVDGDASRACDGDCDDQDASTYPGATEVNDGADNQCPGGFGFGMVDEISGDAGFPAAAAPWEFCWPLQLGATDYEISRSEHSDFSSHCVQATTFGTCSEDPSLPPAGAALFYVVRAVTPYSGSWGQTSSGVERNGLCGPELCDDDLDNDGDALRDCADPDCSADPGCQAGVFTFVDGPSDDIASSALLDFFGSLSPAVTVFIRFTISSAYPPAFEWCSDRAAFYRDSYLSLASNGGTASAASGSVWYRTGNAAWTGPQADAFANYYGNACFGPFSWCSETGLGGRVPTADPAHPLTCEARDAYYGCGDGTWGLTITVGANRASVCGF